jgi:molybdopterin converting factor small subunit
MRVTFKLFANLREYLPEGTSNHVLEIDVPEGTTPADLVETYNLPSKLVHIVLINGHYIAPEARASIALQAGDVLAFWPPVAGG